MESQRLKTPFLLPFLLLALSFAGCRVKTGTGGNEQRPPNILLIVVDDLRPELGCYGHEQIHSPNIDALAAESLLFESAYCQAPICNPSRMSFLSGLRPDQTGIHVNDVPIRDFLPDVVTLPQHFRNNGYATVSMGKVFHQGATDTASWSHVWEGPPQRTYHLERNTSINVVGDGSRRGRPYEDADVPDGLYTDGMITDSALAWMRRFDPENPFFLAVGLMKPHLPFNAPKKYWDLYREPAMRYQRPEGPPEGAPEYAFMNSAELRYYHGVPKEGPVPEILSDTLVHGYYACISYMDAQVGRLLEALEMKGVADNTIVMLYGDHGYKLGDMGDWCKNTHYELDTRVPLMIHLPGRPPGRTRSLTELIDLYPTLLAATGVGEAPPNLSGTSLLPLFEDPEQELKPAAFTIRPRSEVEGYSVRTRDCRLVRWTSREFPDSVVFLEFYDYTQSPVEQVNRAYDSAYRHQVEAHLELLQGL